MGARPQAIERVYRSRYVAFRNTLATVTGSRDTAREVVQEAFARALARRHEFRADDSREGSLEAWIWRIALRLALDETRERQHEPLEDPIANQPAANGHDPRVAAALRSLPPRRRLVVFLRFFADLTYAEIAEICGITEGAVAATIAQGRESLERALHEEGVANG